MVMDAHHRVHILLAQSAHEVVSTFLHLGVSTLHSVQLDAVAVAASVYRRHRAATQTDAVVVATYDHHLVALLGLLLQAVALGAIAHTAGEHDNLVVSIFLSFLLMLESEHRAADERLSKLVAEVAGTV